MYKLAQNCVTRIADGAYIPRDPANREYVEFLAWQANGNTPEPANTPEASAPRSVSPRQARLALRQTGHLTNVLAAIAAADEETQIEWEYATSFDRSSPVVSALSAGLGLAEADLDQLFILAASL